MHREVEICGECASKCSSDHDRSALTPVWSKRYDWNDVNCPNPGMHAAASATLLRRREINGCHGEPRKRAGGKGEGVAVANIGVDAAIVISVVVHIEESHAGRSGNDRREYGEDRRVTPLTDVGDDLVRREGGGAQRVAQSSTRRITGQRPSGPVAATEKFSRSQKRSVAEEVASASSAAAVAGSSGYASTAANPAVLSRVSTPSTSALPSALPRAAGITEMQVTTAGGGVDGRSG